MRMLASNTVVPRVYGLVALLIASACGGELRAGGAAPSLPASGAGASAPAPAAPLPSAPGTAATGSMVPAAPLSPSNDPIAAGGSGGAAALPTGHAGAAGAPHMLDPCVDPTPVALEDSMLTNEPEAWMSPSGSVDLFLPKPVQNWMDARLFKEGHDGWHGVRRCSFLRGRGSRPGRGGAMPGGMASGAGGRTGAMMGSAGSMGGGGTTTGPGGIPLSPAFALCEKPELVAEQQECAGTQDGYQFLVVHRHMIQVLKQAFPAHRALFEGFAKFPFDAQDVPEQWRARFGSGWSSQIIEVATLLEDIENQLERFPTEGDLGQFIQCGGMTSGASSVHGAMHFKWVVNGSPYMLGDSTANLGNFMFWKLHGWIDTIWTRYRVAKGMKDDDPAHVAALVGQCREMHALGEMIGPAKPSAPAQPLPAESGVFHEQVRPILENTCAGCHSGGSPEGGLVLGGQVSSALIVKNLVDEASVRGGQFKRVVAGKPMESWLYLKASGMGAAAGCMGVCNAQVMPPTGMVTLTAAELGTIERWIMQGAPGPGGP